MMPAVRVLSFTNIIRRHIHACRVGFKMMKVDGDGMRDLHVIFHASQNRKMKTRMQTTTRMVISQSRIVESGFLSFPWRAVLTDNLLYEASLQENLCDARHGTCFFDGEEANGLF